MGHKTTAQTAFNRGLVSRLGLARQDVKRIALSAQIMINWIPRVLGSMSIRPGLGYLGATKSNAACRMLEFVFSTSDKALLELTDLLLRVWVGDALITRVAVASVTVNGNFTANVANWTDNDEAGAVSQWVAPGYLELLGTGTNGAIRDQVVTVVAADQNREHALRIVIARGPVTLRVGSTVGGDEYITEATLYTGIHSLALTPTGDFNIRFMNRLTRVVWVDSCNVEAAGVMEIATPWPASVLSLVRNEESADVVFVACQGYQQRRIERRSSRSWAVVLYQSDDGPFRIQNTGPGRMATSVLTGNGTLTSSIPFFHASHVGALFAVTSTGQTVSKIIGALNDATASIRVVGVGTSRAMTIVLSALTATGDTISLYRSFDNATWTFVDSKSWNVDTTVAYTDGLDNQIVYYILKCNIYAAGNPIATLSIPTGSIRGVARATAFTSNLIVSIEVITAFGSLVSSDTWEEGQWSDYRGWPTSLAFYEGRLWFAGKDQIVGSVSDAFSSFSPETAGDSGPINRTIGGAQVDTINWILPLQRLLLGGAGAEYSCKSSSFDEPLTPTNFNPKKASTQGSAAVRAVSVDNQGVFVQRGGTRVYSLALGGGNQLLYDYTATNLSAIIPEIGQPGIVRMAVQRQPDTRVHCIRSDGTVALLIFDSDEQVTCWCEVETDGLVEDVAVLPGDNGDEEDHVYYVVNRTINGSTVRYLERLAFQSQCLGDALCRLADSFVTYSGGATTTISAPHLALENVVVWADGADVGTADDGTQTYTLDGAGNATLPDAVSNYVVGLPYTAPYQSGKLLELQTVEGTPLSQVKAIREIGLIMADVHPKGLQYGSDFNNLYDLPQVEEGVVINADAMRASYDENMIQFPGEWTTDTRMCLQAAAPRPVTIMAAILEVET